MTLSRNQLAQANGGAQGTLNTYCNCPETTGCPPVSPPPKEIGSYTQAYTCGKGCGGM